MNTKKWIKIIVLVTVVVLLSGCAHWMDDMGFVDETVLPPSYPVDNPPPPKTHGTIYQPGYEVTLYRDRVARRIGDILTVRMEESTQGEKQSQIKTNKISSINTNNGSTTNNPSTLNGKPLNPVFFGRPSSAFAFNLGNDMEFDGKGQANQSNKLRGTVSVTVTNVLANNNLVVQGESWVTINQGREYIRLSGIVRPEDIDAENIVSSQRLANARISYSGNGQVGNTSRGGIITQFFTKFFPY
jgi:flagellar L-ring protein precursor FlgH